jgi:lipoprotein NlpD
LVVLFAATGCVSVPKTTQVPLPASTGSAAKTFHRVVKGETLWRIARRYGIDVEALALGNNITDSARLEVGQNLVIPTDQTHDATASRAGEEDFVWPLKGKVVARFSQLVNATVNKGINIMPSHSADVVASRSGTVVFLSEDFLDLGKTLIVAHPDGYWTVYGRNGELLVKLGETVQQGRQIAKAGKAGRDKNVYLHFEIRKGAAAKNPLFYLP